MDVPEESAKVCEYQGYEPPPGLVSPLEEVQPDISPEEFFKRFIKNRKPVLIRGHPIDKDWKGHTWTNAYLKSKASDAEVMVERRGTKKGSAFGLTAPKEEMKYKDFVDNLMADNDRLYLTTQDLERFEDDLDDDEMPKSIMAEPIVSLKGDFPVRPSLLSNLVPYQISLWQGIAKEGTSSGLHHDFHDNLYILLRGRKRFRLFAPSAAEHMKTQGKAVKVHKNGLIVYPASSKNQKVSVRSDGVPYAFLARKKRAEAEAELDDAEEKLELLMDEENDGGLTKEAKIAEVKRLQEFIAACEERIEGALDFMLEEEEVTDSESGYSDDEAALKNQKAESEPDAKKSRLDDDNVRKIEVVPDHFCNIKLPTDSDDPKVVFETCPKLSELGSMSCEVQAGDMLYLPASWFHEVTSYSTEGEVNPEVSHQDKGHLALNYWMFPPDGDTFDRPYLDSFWPDRWRDLQETSKPSSQE